MAKQDWKGRWGLHYLETFSTLSCRLWGTLRVFRQISALEKLFCLFVCLLFRKVNLVMIFHLEL